MRLEFASTLDQSAEMGAASRESGRAEESGIMKSFSGGSPSSSPGAGVDSWDLRTVAELIRDEF